MNVKKLEKIKEYYQEASKYLDIDEPKKACMLLYNTMPVQLYDLSLDILFNHMGKSKYSELRELIKKVDTKLCSVHGYIETEPIDNIFNNEKDKTSLL